MKKDHPIYQLKKHLLRKEPRLILEFSRYIYVSYGVTLSREIFHIKASDLLNGWLEDQVDLLSEGQELALHSKVRLHEEDTNIFHIPMIDFINTKSEKEICSKILSLNEMVKSDLVLFESGNSFHGYYFLLLNEQNWYRFLGKCLLCNPPSRFNEEIVDSRWIGHSLIHGFSALRWSKKTEKYKIVPKLAKKKIKTNELSDLLVFNAINEN